MRKYCFYLMCLFVFTVPWQDAISIGGSRTISSLIGIGVLWLTISVVLAEWRIAKPSALLLVMIGFAAWQFASLAWSIDTAVTFGRVVTLVQLLAMVWLVGELGEVETRRRGLMQAFVAGCSVLAAVVVQSLISGNPIEGSRYAPEQFNLNQTADTLAVGIAMALIVLSHNPRRLVYWANMAYVGLAVCAVIITGSRSGFAATCFALAGVPLLLRVTRPVYRLAWLGMVVGGFAALFFALPANQSIEQNLRRVTFLGETESLDTMTGRTVIWSAGYSVFAEHPVAGIGAGTFSKGVASRLDRARSSHSLFVSTAVETGIVGIVLVLAVLATALRAVVRARGEPRGLHLLLFLVMLTAAFAASTGTSKVMWFGLALLALTDRTGGRDAARLTATPVSPPLRGTVEAA